MTIITHICEWRSVQDSLSPGTTVGLIPTMGALHAGHLSLVERSVNENNISIATIFVNPVQFNNTDDLNSYPSSFDEDCAVLESAGTDFLFAPVYSEMYPDGYTVRVHETEKSLDLCGANRPGHFEGVLTVVLKLLNIFKPSRAYFGEKDYQQLLLIQEMARALFLATEIVPCPIVREESGLAMSSRNRRLSDRGRKQAAEFYRILSSGENVKTITSRLHETGFEPEYVTEKYGRIFAAVLFEGVRLIDNEKR